MARRLTLRQQEILEYVRNFIREQNIPPSLSEIAGHFQISNSTAAFHLKALERKNELSRSSNARSIRLKKNVPVCNRNNCPNRITQNSSRRGSESADILQLPENITLNDSGEPVITFTVSDDSMIDLGIYNGDTVLAMPLEYRDAFSGDLVLAELRDGTVCVRSYLPLTTRLFELHPANRDFKPAKFNYSENPIRAVVTALLRKY